MAAAALRGARVLVVEDEMLIAMELESLLEAEGCVVVGPVGSTDGALALIDAERPDACLLDLNLDGAPAVPVAAALRTRAIPFVLVTGYSRAQSPEPELRDAPRVGKPINDAALLAALAGVLGG